MAKFRIREKKKEKSNAWIPITIALIMVTSVFGVIFFGDNSSVELKYKDIKFTRIESFWTAKINNQQMQFDYHPSEVEILKFDKSAISALENTGMVYFTYNPDKPFAQDIELAKFQLKEFLSSRNVYAVNGLTNSSSFQLPQITCENATSSVKVVYFYVGNLTEVRVENNCIIVEAESARDFSALKDRIIYGMLKIIE